jgi:hypothetical protein
MAELIKKRLEATPLNELQIENNSGTNNGTEDQK